MVSPLSFDERQLISSIDFDQLALMQSLLIL